MKKSSSSSDEVLKWPIEQCHQLSETKILIDEDKTELLNGQIIYRSNNGSISRLVVTGALEIKNKGFFS